MFKKIIRFFMPSNRKLALSAAKGIAKKVNGSVAGKEEVVAKYSTMSAELSQTAKNLADIMTDSRIDEVETETIAKLIEPLIAKAREIVGV